MSGAEIGLAVCVIVLAAAYQRLRDRLAYHLRRVDHNTQILEQNIRALKAALDAAGIEVPVCPDCASDPDRCDRCA